MRDEDTRTCRGIGFVNFLKRVEALAAINALNGRVVAASGSDRVLQISLQSPRESRAYSTPAGGAMPALIAPAGTSNPRVGLPE
jgi:RNA recognition motif-containing protein